MKKILSLFLALLLLLSLAGCGKSLYGPINLPADVTEAAVAESTSADLSEAVPQIIIPGFVGKSIYALEESDNYTVVKTEDRISDEPVGTILEQSPEKGTFADVGSTVSVVVSIGDGTQPTEPDLPPQTDPPEDLPTTRPVLPEQTDPEIPPQPDDPGSQATDPSQTQPPVTEGSLDRNGSYTTKEDVALYIHLYGRLPNNFITKNQAESQYGWSGGSLSKYGKCIGGDRFYNNEGKLPGGYTYYECDIGTLYSSSRGSKRLVFTYSGIVYYTSDHYKTFTQLY